MPSCSKAKNPKGYEIVFTEDDHKYVSIIDGKEINYISGTGFCSKFFPEFDPTGKITARCAEKEGLTVEAMKAKWAAKGKESCRLGTRMHERLEDLFLGQTVRNIPENQEEECRFRNAINIGNKIKERLDILGVEKIVFSPKLKLSGTIDFLGRSKKNGNYVIVDHKSNKEIEKENKYNKFCLDPISHLPDLSFWHYGLQLGLYEYLLKYEEYVPKDAKFQLFLNHVTPEKAELIELPNLQSEIKDMIIYYLLNQDKFFKN